MRMTMGRRAGRSQRSGWACLALACVASWLAAGGSARADMAVATVVATEEQLQNTIIAGHAHVVITEHLDVASLLPYRACLRQDGQISAHESIFCVAATTQTITGSCASPPRVQLSAEYLSRQCVITASHPLFHFSSRAQHGWIDHLYLQHRITTEEVFVNMVLLGSPAAGGSGGSGEKGHVWLTNVTLAGDPEHPHDGSAVEIYDGFDIHMADCIVDGFSSVRTTGSAVYVHGSSAVFQECIFRDNHVSDRASIEERSHGSDRGSDFPAAAAVFGHQSSLWFEQTTLRGNTPHSVAVWNVSSQVFSDVEGFLVFNVKQGIDTLAFSNREVALKNPFLRGDDPWLTTVQQEVREINQVPTLGGGPRPPGQSRPESAPDELRRPTVIYVHAPDVNNRTLVLAVVISVLGVILLGVLVVGLVMWCMWRLHKQHGPMHSAMNPSAMPSIYPESLMDPSMLRTRSQAPSYNGTIDRDSVSVAGSRGPGSVHRGSAVDPLNRVSTAHSAGGNLSVYSTTDRAAAAAMERKASSHHGGNLVAPHSHPASVESRAGSMQSHPGAVHMAGSMQSHPGGGHMGAPPGHVGYGGAVYVPPGHPMSETVGSAAPYGAGGGKASFPAHYVPATEAPSTRSSGTVWVNPEASQLHRLSLGVLKGMPRTALPTSAAASQIDSGWDTHFSSRCSVPEVPQLPGLAGAGGSVSPSPKAPVTSDGEWETAGYSEESSIRESAGRGAGGGGVSAHPADVLRRVLRYLHSKGRMFADMFHVLGDHEQVRGGQSLVQFMKQGEEAYAVKFFFKLSDFERELTFYQISGLRSIMPQLLLACDNEAGRVQDGGGYTFPPFLVMEKGQDLHTWLKTVDHSFITVVQALVHLVECLDSLHTAGWVHRDLKPSNVLRMPRTHAWTLLDFGSAAAIGTDAPLAFTLHYACPEVVEACEAGESSIVSTPAMDMWGLGLIAYEMLTGTRCFDMHTERTEIVDRILGRRPLPWEPPSPDYWQRQRKLRVYKDAVLSCLDRDPLARPSARTLMIQWDRIFTEHSKTREFEAAKTT